MAHILIAEDDDSMRQFLSLALEKAGHTIQDAPDGLKAYEILKTHAFDLLLTDIVMPGMDGIELSKKAKALRPEIKIMYITGFSAVAMEHQQKENAEDAQATLLSKPFHLNELVAQVQNTLKNT